MDQSLIILLVLHLQRTTVRMVLLALWGHVHDYLLPIRIHLVLPSDVRAIPILIHGSLIWVVHWILGLLQRWVRTPLPPRVAHAAETCNPSEENKRRSRRAPNGGHGHGV